MSWSLKILTVRGIPIRVHASFLLILLWAGYLGFTNAARGSGDLARGALYMLIFVLLLFLCVVLHELGHSLVAQLFGVKVQDITLWPIGGVARISRLPEKPYQEFLITAAGPATNVVLALFFGLLAYLVVGPDQMLRLALAPWRIERLMAAMNLDSMLLLLALNNLLLVLFNLIPAFPMDGGRLLRSLLAAVMPFPRATRVASYLGQAIALLLGGVALLAGNVFIGLIALFVFSAAWQEREQAATNAALHGLTVARAMQPLGERLSPSQSLATAASVAKASPQTVYLVVVTGKLAGLITRPELLDLARGPEATGLVGQHMHKDVLRLSPGEDLLATQERLAQPPGAAIVIHQGRAVGTLSRADVQRLAEATSLLARRRRERRAGPRRAP